MSEKHGEMPFGEESRIGIPFNFLIRDILQFDDSLEEAIWFVVGPTYTHMHVGMVYCKL